jgi:hypothetical protein
MVKSLRSRYELADARQDGYAAARGMRASDIVNIGSFIAIGYDLDRRQYVPLQAFTSHLLIVF